MNVSIITFLRCKLFNLGKMGRMSKKTRWYHYNNIPMHQSVSFHFFLSDYFHFVCILTILKLKSPSKILSLKKYKCKMPKSQDKPKVPVDHWYLYHRWFEVSIKRKEYWFSRKMRWRLIRSAKPVYNFMKLSRNLGFRRMRWLNE